MESIFDKLTRQLGLGTDDGSAWKPILRAEGEETWRDWRWWASRLYRLICFGAGLVLLELYLLDLDLRTAALAAPFVLLNLGAALHSITLPRMRRLSFQFILTYANLLLFGPGIAALGSGLGAFGHHLIIRKRPLSEATFQMGRFILAALGAGLVFSALGGRWSVVIRLVNLSWTSVILSVAAYLIIGLALEILPVLWLRRSSLRSIRASFLLRLLACLVFVPMSMSIFYIYISYGLDGVMLFLVPVATFAVALELYARSSMANMNLSIVQEFSRRFSTILEQDQLIREMLKFIAKVISFNWGIIWLKNPGTGDLEARLMLNANGEEWSVPETPSPVVLEAAQTGRPLQSLVQAPAQERFLNGPAALLELAVPLSSHSEALGVLSLCTAAPEGYSAGQRLLLETLAGNAAIAIQNAELYSQTQRLATRDGLTHLYNHRSLQQKLLEEENRAKRYCRHFSLILLDIDLFKTYNDSFGHPAGDQLLVALGRILQSSVRRVDFVARYGGEEFAIVLPECDKERAFLVAERLRKNVEGFPNPHGEHFNLTISAGVSSFPVDGESREEVLEKADKALYKAKREGRNRVCR